MGTVAGVLLGPAILATLPPAVAFADNAGSAFGTGSPLDDTFNPGSSLTVTGLYNMVTAPPGANASIQGYQDFTVVDDNGDAVVPGATFSAYQTTVPFLNAARTGEVIFVTSDAPGSESNTGAVPPDGSVFGYLNSGIFENYYAAIPGTGPGTGVTDILTGPLGRLDFSWLFQLLDFDASDVRNVLPSYLTPVGGADAEPTFTGITGLPPVDVAMQGYQQFELLHDGSPAGTFDAVQTKTTDFMGFHTEALLVTHVPADTTTGTDLQHVPPVGSIFNTMELNALPGVQLVYSSLPAADGTDVVNTFLNVPVLGDINLSWLFQSFDASAGLADHSAIGPVDFSVGSDDYTIKPAGDTQFTGVNGLPPFDVSIQGTQTFDVVNQDGDTVETFTASVTSMPQMWWTDNSLALLVTGTSTDNPVLPVGSVFDVVNHPLTYSTTYYDLPGLGADGANLIKELVTFPGLNGLLGGLLPPLDVSWLAQGTDAAANLTGAGVSHATGDWLDLFAPADP